VGDLYPDHAGEGLRRQIVQLGAVCRTPACLGAAIYQSQFCSESSPRNGPSFAARRPPHRRRARRDAGEGVLLPRRTMLHAVPNIPCAQSQRRHHLRCSDF
jgi:hypothetical protein